jgi:hypothetical protein
VEQIPELINALGLPIVLVILFLRGDLVAGHQYKRLAAEFDRKTKLLEESVIPMAAKAADLLEKSQRRIDELERDIRRGRST